VNTAEPEVLACLPGIEQDLAYAIVRYRESSGYFANVAELLNVPGMSRDLLRQISPRVSVRSDTFRIMSEGEVPSTGARQRIEVVVRVGTTSVDTLAYREDL
jgi:competence ComEA-like helix-hairpin-helix protein